MRRFASKYKGKVRRIYESNRKTSGRCHAFGCVGLRGSVHGGGDNPPDNGQEPSQPSGTFSQTLTFTDKAVISHDANHAYGRIVEADDGTLIATAEDFSDSGIPIYRSTDQGKTFAKNEENIHDPTYDGYSAFDARWQPTLYVLPEDVGTEMKKGDILLVATSIDGSAEKFYQTVLNLYISKDVGLTWTFMSEITRSGNMASTNGDENGCWEGNLYVNAEGMLTCIFADETDHKNHSQRIAMKTTADGKTWSALQEVVALDSPTQRPGMPCVTKIKDGKYLLTIEMVGENGVPIYWKTSDDGIDWGPVNEKGNKIQAEVTVVDAISGKERKTTAFPGSSPFCVWTPYGADENGTIFVTAQRTEYSGSRPADGALMDFFVSYDLGATWSLVDHPLAYFENNNNRPAYSNSMHLSRDGKHMYVVNTILALQGSPNNVLTFTDVDLESSMGGAKS